MTVWAFFKRHEATFSSLSVLISAIGLVIAASSAWMGWRQVSIMSKDRDAPYKTAIYTARIASIRENTQVMGRVRMSFTCVKTLAIVESKIGADKKRRQACIDEFDGAVGAAEAPLTSSMPIWSEATQRAIANYVDLSGKLRFCEGKRLMIGDVTVPGLNSQPRCATFDDDLANLEHAERRFYRSMLTDMRDLTRPN